MAVKIGVWENNVFIGVILFGRGANSTIGSPYNLDITEVCELTRVALNVHISPISKIVKIALRMLKKQSKGLQLVVSYADTKQKHLGIIYQAGNWIYTGPAKKAHSLIIKGVFTHMRSVNAKYGRSSLPWIRKYVDIDATWIEDEIKHKYIMPLNSDMRKKVIHFIKPYPKCLIA